MISCGSRGDGACYPFNKEAGRFVRSHEIDPKPLTFYRKAKDY